MAAVSKPDADVVAFIKAARRIQAAGQMDPATAGEIAEIWERSPNPAVLAGECVGVALKVADSIARLLGAADGPALTGRFVEEWAAGEPERASEPGPAADLGGPQLSEPEPVVIDLGDPEITAPAIAAILAAFDGDKDGLNAVLGTLTRVEAISVATVLAYGIARAAAGAGEDRDKVRAVLAQLLQQPPQP
jgi:hypothetical protein